MAQSILDALKRPFKILGLTCSCTRCDNNACLGQTVAESCSCEDCLQPDTCLYLAKKAKSVRSDNLQPTNDNLQSTSDNLHIRSTDNPYRGQLITRPPVLHITPPVDTLSTAKLYELCRKNQRTPAIVSATASLGTNAALRTPNSANACSSTTTSSGRVCICPGSGITHKRRRDQTKPVSVDYLHGAAGCVLEFPNDSVQIMENQYLPDAKSSSDAFSAEKDTEPQEPVDYLQGAAGYVFDLLKDNMQIKLPTYLPLKSCLSKSCSAGATPLNEFPVKQKTDKQDSADFLQGTAEYKYELPKDKVRLNPKIYLSDPRSCRNTDIETPLNTYSVKKGTDTQLLADPLQGTSGYSFELPKNNVQVKQKKYLADTRSGCGSAVVTPFNAYSVKNEIYKQNSVDDLQGSAGYNIFELPEDNVHVKQYKNIPDRKSSCGTAVMSPFNAYSVKKEIRKQVSVDSLHGIAGYNILEIPDNIHVKKYKNIQDAKSSCVTAIVSPFNAYSVKKETYKQDSVDSSQGIAGYNVIIDYPEENVQVKQYKKIRDAKSSCGTSIVSPVSAYSVKKETNKQDSADSLQGIAANNKFELAKDNMKVKQKQYLPDTKSFSGSTVVTPISTSLVKKVTDYQDSADSLQGTSGYIFELPKYNVQMKQKKYFQDAKSGCDTAIVIPLKKVTDQQDPQDYLQGAAGYVLELQKYGVENDEDSPEAYIDRKQKEDSDKQVFNITRFETKRITCGTLKNMYKANSSQCNDSAITETESRERTVTFQQYKPTNNARELFRNILETQRNSIQILTNTIYQEKTSERKIYTEILDSPSSEYVYELPKNTNNFMTQKSSFESCESAERNLKSLGSVPELKKFDRNPHDPGHFSQVFGMFETKLTGSASKNQLIKKDAMVDCKELAKRNKISLGISKHGKINEYHESGKNKCLSQELSKFSDRTPHRHNVGCPRQVCSHEKPEAKSLKKGPVFSRKCKCIQSERRNIQERATGTQTCHLWKKILKKETDAIEALKKIYLPQDEPSKHNTSSAPVLCKEILQKHINSVELLKKINLSLKSDATSTANGDILNKPVDILDEYCRLYLPQTSSATSSLKCVSAELNRGKDIEELHKGNDIEELNRGNDIEELKRVKDIEELSRGKDFEELSRCKDCEDLNRCKDSEKFSRSKDQLATSSHNHPAQIVSIPSPVLDVKVTDKKSSKEIKNLVARRHVSNTKLLTTNDILMRIKEAYMACSCKICECVAGKSINSKECKCKPCDCVVCPSNIKGKKADKLETCECKTCDYDQCKYVAKHCKCEPCQCGDCRMKTSNQRKGQTFVVAPVGVDENAQGGTCGCSPCVCIECGVVYPLSNIRHEMSTSTARHLPCRCEICLNQSCVRNTYESCKCHKNNRLMRKPVEQDTHDFDIRRAAIVHKKPMY